MNERNGQKYKATIIDTTTGEQRETPFMQDVPFGDGTIFWWTEGNYSCDCNRAWLFVRAKDGRDAPDPDAPCSLSRPGRYRVPSLTLEDGTIVEIDTPEVKA